MSCYRPVFRGFFRFYVACLWTGELDFFYYLRSKNCYSKAERSRKHEIMRRAGRMGAFN